MKSFFKRFDEDGDDQIDREEFLLMVEELGITPEEVHTELFNSIDTDCNGCISFDEYCSWWTRGIADNVRLEQVSKMLKRKYFARFLRSITSTARISNTSLTAKILGTAEKGEVFGEITFLEGGGASASVIAESHVEYCMIEGHVLQILFEWKPQLAAKFFNFIATTLEKRLKALENILFSEAVARVK